jgi:hypothetical protein
MDRYVNVETTFHMMNLLQLGATVQVVSGKMVYVQFELETGLKVAYVYHINKNNHYFLERIKPYPLPIKEIENAKEVIELIQIDYEQFKNAVHTNKIHEFVETNKEMHQTMKSFEDLFLYYNVPENIIHQIHENLNAIQKTIKETSEKSERLYFKKDPDNL